MFCIFYKNGATALVVSLPSNESELQHEARRVAGCLPTISTRPMRVSCGAMKRGTHFSLVALDEPDSQYRCRRTNEAESTERRSTWRSQVDLPRDALCGTTSCQPGPSIGGANSNQPPTEIPLLVTVSSSFAPPSIVGVPMGRYDDMQIRRGARSRMATSCRSGGSLLVPQIHYSTGPVAGY